MVLKKIKLQPTRIDMVTIKNKIKKVLTDTRSTNAKRHKELQKKRSSIRQKLIDQQEFLQYQGDYRICEVWEGDEKIETIQDDFQYEQTKYGIKEYEQMLVQFDEESQQLRNDEKVLSMYAFESLADGLSKFESNQQIKQIDNADIKKQVLQIGDLYEDGVLKIDKINQIYNTYYNLSIQQCGICLNQPKIYQIIVLRCGHWLCFDCFKNFASSQRIRNQFRKCPFCRQQIEYISNE